MSIVRVFVDYFKSLNKVELTGFTDLSVVRVDKNRNKIHLWEALNFVLRDNDDQPIPRNGTKVRIVIHTDKGEVELGKEIKGRKIIYTMNNEEVPRKYFRKDLTQTKISFINWKNYVEKLKNFITNDITSYLKKRAMAKLDPSNELFNEMAHQWETIKVGLEATKSWNTLFKLSKKSNNVRQDGLQALIKLKNVMEEKKIEYYLANLHSLDEKILPLKEENKRIKKEVEQDETELFNLSEKYKDLIDNDLNSFFKESMDLTERNEVIDNGKATRILKKIKENNSMRRGFEIFSEKISDSTQRVEEENMEIEEDERDLIDSDEWTDKGDQILGIPTASCSNDRINRMYKAADDMFFNLWDELKANNKITHDYADIKRKLETKIQKKEKELRELKESCLVLTERQINNCKLKKAETRFYTAGLPLDKELERKRVLLIEKEKDLKLEGEIFKKKVEIKRVEKTINWDKIHISQCEQQEKENLAEGTSRQRRNLPVYKTLKIYMQPELKEEYLKRKRSFNEFLKGMVNDLEITCHIFLNEYEQAEAVSSVIPTPSCSIANILSFIEESKNYMGKNTLKLKRTINDLKTQIHNNTLEMLKYIDKKDEIYQMAQCEGIALPFIEKYVSPFCGAQVTEDIIANDKIIVDYTNLNEVFKSDIEDRMYEDMEEVLENYAQTIEALEKLLMTGAPEANKTQLKEARVSHNEDVKSLLRSLININEQRSVCFNEAISYVNTSINTILKRMCYYTGEFKLTNIQGTINMTYMGQNVTMLPLFQRCIIALAFAIVVCRVEESNITLFCDENMPLKFEYYLKNYFENARDGSTQFISLVVSDPGFFRQANTIKSSELSSE